MTFYTRQIESTKRTIARKGELVTWREPAVAAVADTTQPWIETNAAAPVEHTVRILFLPIPRINSQTMRYMLTQGGIPGGNVQGLMGAVPFVPTLTGIVVRSDGRVLAVKNIEALEPDGTPILYTVEFEQ